VSEDNRALLERLFDDGAIHVERAGILETMPSPAPIPATPALADRVEGMLLGLAIGDALGNTTEGMTPQMRGMTFGEIRSYLPQPRARGREIGLPTDDTQLAFWTLEQLLEDGALVPESLGRRFCRDRTRIVGIGGTVAEFLHDHCENARPWHASGPRSAGNGALMRIAPVLVPHVARPSPALWADVALAAMLTHNDPAAIAASLAFVDLLWRCLATKEAPAPEWWLDTFIAAMRPLEGETGYRPRSLRYSYEGPVSEFAETVVRAALRHRLAVSDACEEWLSGAFLLETMPSVLYILCRHGHDPEQAIVRAVNDTTDNDTIAAIVGAAVGALHGRAKLPERWIEGLSGRTLERDDGRVPQLIAQAIARWVTSAADARGAETRP
jgi:ADP-ribosyl-[dinitrogen reductase] hydrolase